MAEPAVVDASPLILLTAADVLHLLRLAGEPAVYVPHAVVQEVEAYGPTDPTVDALRKANWITIVEQPPVPVQIVRWDLGPGETAVVAWAHSHPGTIAVLDDLPARRCADSLGIPTRGTLGLILVAKQRGLVDAARPLLERLKRAGMCLSDDLVRRALSMVGE